MACDPARVKDALAAQLRNRVARDVTVYAWEEAYPDADCLLVYEAESDPLDYFDDIGDGYATLTLIIEAWVSAEDAETRSRKLDDFASIGTGAASSITDAIDADRTLGITNVNAVCLAMASKVTTDDTGRGVATWQVQVIVPKN